MDKYFTKTFFKFLFGFLAIIGVSFTLLALMAQETLPPVDNVAQPQ
jgi:hypothetical protein